MSSTVTRRQVLTAARTVDLPVADMHLGRAVRRAIAHYNQRNPDKPPATPQSNPQFLERITVNYLRHICSNYDQCRDFLRGITDPATRAEAGAIIKGRQLSAIAVAYPALAAEAKRQATWEDNKPNCPRGRASPQPRKQPLVTRPR